MSRKGEINSRRYQARGEYLTKKKGRHRKRGSEREKHREKERLTQRESNHNSGSRGVGEYIVHTSSGPASHSWHKMKMVPGEVVYYSHEYCIYCSCLNKWMRECNVCDTFGALVSTVLRPPCQYILQVREFFR